MAAAAKSRRQGAGRQAEPRRPRPSRSAKPKPKPQAKPRAGGQAGDRSRAARPLQPAAGRAPLAEEAEHVARYDAAIAPARDLAVSRRGCRPACARRSRPRPAASSPDAKALRDKITDPAARKLVDWYLYRGGYGTASEIRAFLDANPAWPDRGLLTQRAEEALFNSPAERRARSRPSSPTAQPRDRRRPGRARHRPISPTRTRRSAKALAQKAWTELDIPASLEPAFLEARRPAADGSRPQAPARPAAVQRQPLDRRAQRARRRHPPRDRRCCRRTRRRRRKRALPCSCAPRTPSSCSPSCRPQAQADWGLAVQRAQALRRQKKEEEAWKILLAEPEATGARQARRLVGGAARQRLCGAAGSASRRWPTIWCAIPAPLSVNAGKDAAFLAGWLALRHLNDAKLALGHFEALAKAADGPLSQARGHYWLGRTHEALGDKAKAQEHYKRRVRLLRHLPRPARAPEARSQAPAA